MIRSIYKPLEAVNYKFIIVSNIETINSNSYALLEKRLVHRLVQVETDLIY